MESCGRICPFCRNRFLPSRYRPQQRVCSRKRCQQRRKREYHRRKLESDPEYRQTCRDSQRKWRERHPDYQRQYRMKHPEYVEQNRQSQPERDRRRRLGRLVKNNLALPVSNLSAEVYLCQPEKGHLVKNNVASSQVYIFQQPQRRSVAGG
jgi:hypothetical protein